MLRAPRCHMQIKPLTGPTGKNSAPGMGVGRYPFRSKFKIVVIKSVFNFHPFQDSGCITIRYFFFMKSHGIVVYKFGVNSLRGEYKLLRIFIGDPPLQYHFIPACPTVFEAEVYTLDTSQWRSLGQVPCQLHGFRGPFLNGCFHWNVSHQDENICTFDSDKERRFNYFRRLLLDLKIVFKGCLCKSYTYDFQLTTWVIRQYTVKESWHKELVISQPICAGGPDWRPVKDCMYVFGGLQDGTILVVAGNKLFAYCPKSKTIEDLAILSRQSILLTHRPSFIKLQNIDSERVHTF
ncbi:hypothetical protein OSB04_015692 [Centaurea solstitialis]|uniref:F-box associated domain-containing protein n=1 Tax=Centaurea solstitialis TaxID=347529 RepID=A0AA38W7R1_9ASTR|nr:hypothetical protein OSB04_015692 [Centaurea solstitialis]